MVRVNRLSGSMSPYLLQHAENPVDWWEWGPEAFAEARRRDVPIFLSVGYAACHWCHVMAHDCFEDEATAELLSASVVSVKVDREERPDVDAVYMEATQAMTGQGGWPMTVFCTPDGSPFYCGTYFPRQRFQQLVGAISTAWRDNREAVLSQGQQVVQAITGEQPAQSGVPLTAEVLDAGVRSLHQQYDPDHAGFGRAPKFPPSMVLEFLLRHHHRTGSALALEMARRTCEAMARGGMYDQLAGGFARYSVDEAWVVPHFEKMLYDNALLLRVYTNLWRATGLPLARRVAEETAGFLVNQLGTAEGGFASALDADAGGVEGLTYAWTPAQLAEVLGEADGAWAAGQFTVTAEGTFEFGASVLQRLTEPEDPARYESVRARLLAARGLRPQPARDDKVVTAWNALAMSALAEFGAITGHHWAVESAVAAAELIERVQVVDGRLRRTSRAGRPGSPAGVLEDYGCLAEAYCVLHQVTAEPRWLRRAGELLDTVLTRFADGEGGFYDTADDSEALVKRPRDPADNATPAGSSAVAGALLSYSALTASVRHREIAVTALSRVGSLVARQARFAGWAAATGEAVLAGPAEIAIVGDETGSLSRTAWTRAPGGAVIVSGFPDADGVPLLASRPLAGGLAAAYICRGFVCEKPITDSAELAAALGIPQLPSGNA
jgi:uncharacterized protein YyaL (SSP411 family)